MKNMRVTQRILGPLVAGGLLAAVAMPAEAVDLTTPDGNWTFSVSGEVNVDYIYSSCENLHQAAAVDGGLTCIGTGGGSNASNVGNGLLPASIAFGVKTTQNGIDISAHFGFFPGIATNDGGSPNGVNSANLSTNTALGTTGLDIRQVYLQFGNKTMGTFLFGRNIGLFGADAILSDMTLPGVGAPGSAAGPAPTNTTLGGIGFGYIYTDWLAQMDYTTPDFSGFNLTAGIFDPLNSLTDEGTTQPKKAPGFHAKATYTMAFSDTTKLYGSVAFITQQQYYGINLTTPPVNYNYTGDGVDLFVKLNVDALEVFGYGYHAKGLGTTALFNLGSFANGETRTSSGYLFQATYKLGDVKLGANYGVSKLDYANALDQLANPFLVSSNKKGTLGVYWSLTKNLMLLAEASRTWSESQSQVLPHTNGSNTFNIGAYFGF
jgi:predicted porin